MQMWSSLTISSSAFFGSIDEIRQIGRIESVGEAAIGDYVAIRGWVLDTDSRASVLSVDLGLDKRVEHRAVIGIDRPDVRDAHGERALKSGFIGIIPVRSAEIGAKPLHLRITSPHAHVDIALSDALTTRRPSDPFAGLSRRQDGWAFALDGMFVGDVLAPLDRFGVSIVSPEGFTSIRGWAIDEVAGRPAREIIARAGGRYLHVLGGLPRPDVAANTGYAAAVDCGFVVPFLPSPIGVDEIRLYAITENGGYSYLDSVRARQFQTLGSSALPESDDIRSSIDEFTIGGRKVESDGQLAITAGTPISLRGWAVDSVGPRLTGGIELLLDDAVVVQTQTNLPRPDVAESFGDLGVTESEFALQWAMPPLAVGTYRLSLRAFSARRDATALLTERELIVEAAGSV